MPLPLERLLALAGRGYHVFPLEPNGKRPLPGSHGVKDATTDPDQIRLWHTTLKDCNWGVDCGRSGLLVVDLDTKGGHDGIAAWQQLLTGTPDHPTTARVKTPSGGAHLYYKGAGPSTASKLAPGIDTRGEGGYVLLPGCTIDGKAYEFEGGTPQELPTWLAEKLRPAAPAPAAAQAEGLDAPAAILRAGQYLAEAPAAVEGEGGDATTLRVALRVKDLGISEPTCLELMAAAYNPRCVPPWDEEQLATKVSNAYRYGKREIGADGGNPFAPVAADPAPEKPRGIVAVQASAFDPAAIKPRPWILGHDLIAGFITATVAQGGAGKSMVTMLEALSVASGRELTGVPVHKRGAAWIYNTEDPMDELGRRVIAAAKHHGVPLSELGNLHVSSGRTAPLILAQSNRGEVTTNVKAFEQVIDFIQTNGITLWVLDPFIHAHMCDENSNAEMAHVMLILGAIAERTGCSISLVHHATKGAGGEGNMDKARGASAFGGAVRIMRTVATMSEDDARTFGLPPERRRWFLRLDDAKGNMAPPATDARWFEKHDHVLPNGDHVGTVATAQLQKVQRTDFSEARDAVFEAVVDQQLHPETYQVDEVVPILKARDKQLKRFHGWKPDRIGQQIREAFEGTPVHVPGTLLQVLFNGSQLVISKGNGDWLD